MGAGWLGVARVAGVSMVGMNFPPPGWDAMSEQERRDYTEAAWEDFEAAWDALMADRDASEAEIRFQSAYFSRGDSS